MGKLPARAIEEAQKLPESEQEAVGAWLLEELESRAWDQQLERDAANGKLAKLFEPSRAEHRRRS